MELSGAGCVLVVQGQVRIGAQVPQQGMARSQHAQNGGKQNENKANKRELDWPKTKIKPRARESSGQNHKIKKKSATDSSC